MTKGRICSPVHDAVLLEWLLSPQQRSLSRICQHQSTCTGAAAVIAMHTWQNVIMEGSMHCAYPLARLLL